MTLTVALKYKNGSIIATDTRLMYNHNLKRDQAGKLTPLMENIGIASFGLKGATDDILKSIKNFSNTNSVSFDDVCYKLCDICLEWFNENNERIINENEKEEEFYGFVIASPERIRIIDKKGYSEEIYDYDCEGNGINNGLYILQNMYKKNMEEDEVKELVVYTILETSKIDPTVSEDIQIAVFPKAGKHKFISTEEIMDIKSHLVPISLDIIKNRNKTTEDIIQKREEINNLWNEVFGFKLFLQNEKAIFQISLTCRNENEFTNNITALALLIEQLNIKEMKKVNPGNIGSINIFESFLSEKIKIFPPEIISNLRDIVTMRSKKFPIHTTDVKFVEVVIKIIGIYPPVWSNLYLKTLNMYKESLNKLLICLQGYHSYSCKNQITDR